MDILGAVFDTIGDATSSRKRISFTSYSVPYRAVKHLEQYGIKVWIGASPQREGDKVHCTIQVSAKQHRYAAGLLAGLSDIVVTNPDNPKPIRPSKSWGKPPKAKGILTSLIRGLS